MRKVKKCIENYKVVAVLIIFFTINVEAMKVSQQKDIVALAKKKMALAEQARRKVQEGQKAEETRQLREIEKIQLTKKEEQEVNLKPNEYFIYAAGDDKNGVKISREALERSDLLKSMIDFTDISGGKKIPLEGYSLDQIKIVCGDLKNWLENKKAVEDGMGKLSLEELIARANLFNVFGVSFDIMKIILNCLDEAMQDKYATVDDLKQLNLDVQKLMMTNYAVEHLRNYMVRKKDSTVPDYIIGKETENIRAVAFSPDGKIIVAGDSSMLAGGNFDNLILWKTDDLKNPRVFKNVYNINVVAFSPDGKKIAVGCLDDILVFDITNLDNITFKSVGNIGGDVIRLAFSPDGTKIVSGSRHRCLLWDIANLNNDAYKSNYKFIGGDDIENVGAVTFSPDGNTIAMGSSDKLMLWDIRNINNIVSRQVGMAKGIIRAIAFNPDGNSIVVGSLGEIALWDLKNNTSHNLQDGVTAIGALVFSSRGDEVYSIFNEGKTKYFCAWDVSQSDKKTLQMLVFPYKGDSAAACSLDGSKIIMQDKMFKISIKPNPGDQPLYLFMFATDDQKLLIEAIKGYTDINQIRLIYELCMWLRRRKPIQQERCNQLNKTFETLPPKMQKLLLDFKLFCEPKRGLFGLW